MISSLMAIEERLRDDVSCLVEAAQRLCVARDVNTVIDIVRHAARRLASADGATFVLREGEYVYYAGEDSKLPLWQGRRFLASECISGWSITHRESVVIEDIYVDPRVPHAAYHPTYVKSLAMVPVNRQDPIAAIGVYWEERHVLSAGELALLQALADAAATAVANTELYRGLVAAREELEHTTARLRLALEAGAIGTWDWDLRSNELSWDEKTKEMFALPKDSAVDYPLFVTRLQPEDRAHTQAAVDAALAGANGGFYETEYRTLPFAGSGERWIAARGRALFDGEQRAIRFVGTVRDVTEQKTAEAEKTELLRNANAANTAKDEFLAMLGHELRNPLAPIVTAVELLKLRGQGETREVASIERQAQHLIRLVDDLLDVARVTRGKLELKSRRVELAGIVAKAIEMAAPLIEQRRHVLEVSVEPGTVVYGDDVRLAQVFSNLLTNAAKYTPSGGRIRVTSHKRDQKIAIEISDSGRGITAELLPRLFTPFVQAAQTSERAEGGLGLGLALANSIIESHHGKITAHSAGTDQGSTFIVTLPESSPLEEINAQRQAVNDHDDPQPRAAGLERDILVVDDNEDAAELLAVLLRKHGHRVVIAHDPVKALEAVRDMTPDVAFLDIGLPVMDGYELASHFRKELGARCPVLIAVTGYGQQRDRERSRAASFALHLVKPVQQASVLEALKQLESPQNLSEAGE